MTTCTVRCNTQKIKNITLQLQVDLRLLHRVGGSTAASSERSLGTRCHLRDSAAGPSVNSATGDAEPQRPHEGQRAGEVSRTNPARNFYPDPPLKHKN